MDYSFYFTYITQPRVLCKSVFVVIYRVMQV